MRKKVFLSYRRADSMNATGRVYERLVKRYGKQAIFKDLDSIRGASRFQQDIDQALAQSAVLIVIIGRNWLDMRDEYGRRRLDLPDDFVRREIETALRLHVPVLPILVEGAQMPRREWLPYSLQPLVEFNALEIPNYPFFEAGVRRLGKQVDTYVPRGMRPAVRTRRTISGAVAIVLILSLLAGFGYHEFTLPHPVVAASLVSYSGNATLLWDDVTLAYGWVGGRDAGDHSSLHPRHLEPGLFPNPGEPT